MRVTGDTLPARVGSDPHAPVVSSLTSSPVDLIEVRAPYCALFDVCVPELGRATAIVQPELALTLEIGAISAAEAGRHMAILGSVACASAARDRRGRSFYLAQRALLRTPEVLTPHHLSFETVQVSARATDCDARSASAKCEIRALDGTLLYELDVAYKLVPEKVFQRLFSAFRVDMRSAERRASAITERPQAMRRTPYRDRLPVTVTELDTRHIRSELRSIPAAACAGHFPLYPALPVAVLMEVLSQTAGTLLRSHRGDPQVRFRSIAAEIAATRLVFAGQSLVIEGDVIEDVSDTRVRMEMRARLPEGEEVAVATFVMEAVPSPCTGS